MVGAGDPATQCALVVFGLSRISPEKGVGIVTPYGRPLLTKTGREISPERETGKCESEKTMTKENERERPIDQDRNEGSYEELRAEGKGRGEEGGRVWLAEILCIDCRWW
jgi:hypothetical protein